MAAFLFDRTGVIGENRDYTHSSNGNIHNLSTAWELPGQRQADFFCGTLNGITFPYSSGGIHFFAFFLKLSGTKNSIIFALLTLAINHPTYNNQIGAKKFLFLTNLYESVGADFQ